METFELDKFQKLIDNNKDKLGLSSAKLGTVGVKISLAHCLEFIEKKYFGFLG